MLKKIFTVAIIAVAGVFVINQTAAGDKFVAWLERVTKKKEKELTIDEQLAHIKKEVAALDKDIDKVKGDLAESNVNVRLLRSEVDDLRNEIKESDVSVRKHGDVLKSASTSDRIQWGYRTVSYVDAKELLQSEVKRHKELKDRLNAREAALASQEQTRELVAQQLDEMLAQKKELLAAVLDMENVIRLAKLEQIRSKHQNDGTRMAEIKRSMADLKKRVMIQREKLNIDAKVNRSPAEDKSVEQIMAELDGQPIKTTRTTGEDVKVVTPSDKE